MVKLNSRIQSSVQCYEPCLKMENQFGKTIPTIFVMYITVLHTVQQDIHPIIFYLEKNHDYQWVFC